MAKKIIKLTEADLEKIVLRIVNEQISIDKNRDVEKTVTTDDAAYKNFVAKTIPSKKRQIESLQKRYDFGDTLSDLNIALYAAGLYGRNLVSGAFVDGKRKQELVLNEKSSKFKTFEQLQSYMDTESKAVFNEIKEKLPSFYAYVAFKSNSLMLALDNAKRKTRTVTVLKAGEKNVEKPKAVEMPTIEFTDAGIPFDSKFESCSPKLKADYVNTFNESFAKGLAQALETTRSANDNSQVSFPGAFYIKSVKVLASSSRVPHTKNCDPKYYINNDGNDEQGFLNLSQDRANAIKNLVVNYIKNNPNTIKTAGQSIFDMTEVIGATGPEWDPKKGANHQDYRNNQQAKVIITFMVMPKIETDKEVVQAPQKGYLVTVAGEGRTTINFKFPKIKFPTIRLGGGTGIRPGHKIEMCPSF